MKKEINEILSSEKGQLKINKYSTLIRYTKDALGLDVDVLKIEFSINHVFDFVKEIESRDWEGVVEEIKAATAEAFDQARDEFIKEISNGKIAGKNVEEY